MKIFYKAVFFCVLWGCSAGGDPEVHVSGPSVAANAFHTKDGRSFALVVGLRVDGAVCNPNPLNVSAVNWTKLPFFGPGTEPFKDLFVVPYQNLPDELRKRYDWNDPFLDAQLKKGIEGEYGPLGTAFAGVTIELSHGRFTLSHFTDARDSSAPPPIFHGTYSVRGRWLILHDPTLDASQWVFADIHNRLYLLDPNAFLKWRDHGFQDELGWLERRPK